MTEWLLWPGVSLMVCATLTSLAVRLLQGPRRQPADRLAKRPAHARVRFTLWPAAGLLLAIALVVTLQVLLFGINGGMALLSIPLAICLAVVAARVVGATGIAPIGAIGKLSQLSFGLVAPGQVAIAVAGASLGNRGR